MATILLVDDSNLSRRILRRILEPDGHAILEAADGMAAIERYFLDHPDLVLLDMTMSGMHGLEVLSKLREIDPGARVIVATADIQSSTRSLVQEAGGAGFVSKPFVEEQVRSAVNAVLASEIP
jgi:two-component system, chemotaxis family, chemotaxis protein CheY